MAKTVRSVVLEEFNAARQADFLRPPAPYVKPLSRRTCTRARTAPKNEGRPIMPILHLPSLSEPRFPRLKTKKRLRGHDTKKIRAKTREACCATTKSKKSGNKHEKQRAELTNTRECIEIDKILKKEKEIFRYGPWQPLRRQSTLETLSLFKSSRMSSLMDIIKLEGKEAGLLNRAHIKNKKVNTVPAELDRGLQTTKNRMNSASQCLAPTLHSISEIRSMILDELQAEIESVLQKYYENIEVNSKSTQVQFKLKPRSPKALVEKRSVANNTRLKLAKIDMMRSFAIKEESDASRESLQELKEKYSKPGFPETRSQLLDFVREAVKTPKTDASTVDDSSIGAVTKMETGRKKIQTLVETSPKNYNVYYGTNCYCLKSLSIDDSGTKTNYVILRDILENMAGLPKIKLKRNGGRFDKYGNEFGKGIAPVKSKLKLRYKPSSEPGIKSNEAQLCKEVKTKSSFFQKICGMFGRVFRKNDAPRRVNSREVGYWTNDNSSVNCGSVSRRKKLAAVVTFTVYLLICFYYILDR